MTIRSYQDLKVWQKSMDLVETAYELARGLPSSERFELASQIRRASVSIAANIAEGYGRGSTPDYVRFLRVAFSSGLELETLASLSGRLNLVNQGRAEALLAQSQEVGRMLAGLIRSLRDGEP